MGESTDSLLAYLDKCGLSVVLADPPHPPDTLLLRGPKEEKTPAVLAAVKKHKAELVKRLAPEKPAAVPEKAPLPVTAEIEAECVTCRAMIYFPGASGGVFCERANGCPHPRLGTVPVTGPPMGWRW